MEQLRLKFIKLINDTVLISIKEVLTYNYNLGIEWLQEVANALIPLHKRDECLQSEFYTKYSKFIKVFESFLPNAYSDTSIEVYRKYYNQIKKDILDLINSKMRKINYYYFNISIYDDNFYFVYQINNEIEYLINNLNNYYSDDYFDTEIAIYIYSITSESLKNINEELRAKFESLKKTCEKYTDYVRGRNWGDYCWNNRRISHKWHYYSVPHTNNYKKLDNTFTNIENFIKNESNLIIQKFTNNFSPYLNTYINDIQTLFDNIYNYTETKLKSNEDLNELINQYLEILNNMYLITENEIELKGIDVEFLMEKVKNKSISIDSDFFEKYYLNNFTSYLEYPDEVLFKLSNLENELNSCSEIIKHNINYIINKKMWRIKEDNYYFIMRTNDFFNELIKFRINNTHIFEYYKEYRLTNNFGTILRKYNYTNNETKKFLTENIYDNNINKIINEYSIIFEKIEQRINKDWILKNCTEINIITEYINSTDNIDDTNSTNLICYEYKNRSSLNYSEYNFNVVKIRTGIYYIKYLYEKLEYLFNQFNIDDVLNLSKIIQKDEIINDKNIINLNQKSNQKLYEINEEAEDVLKEYFEYYKEDINETIKNELDFTINLDKFSKILNYTEENFIQEVERKSDNITFLLFELLQEYNETLMKQIKLTKKYEKYNFNKTIFNRITNTILEKIEQSFDNVINNTKNIMDDYIFKNALKMKLENLNNEKAQFFRNFVDDLNINYEIKPFNLTYVIGKRTENFILNVLNNIMFSHIYEYIELYEKNNNIYIKSLLNLLNIIKEKVIKTFKEITNNFYDYLNANSTEYINKEYLQMYENNYTICLNYSKGQINETIKRDEENYNKYIIYITRKEMCEKRNKKELNIYDIDIIKLNLNESNIIEIIDKIKEKQKLKNETNLLNYNFNNTNDTIEEIKNETFELNEYLNNICEEVFNNKFIFVNETEIHLDCENKSYYSNYLNLTYFTNFDIELLNNLTKISSKNQELIPGFYFGGEFIENYLFSNDYIILENYTDFSIKPFKFNLENFQDISEYINYRMDKIYYEFMTKELYEAFNLSFSEFMKNAISANLEGNILIYINDKIDINVKYIIQKLINEKGYYFLLLNKTKEIGITSKNAFISLYDYIYDRINKTLNYQIEDYIRDNIIFFYKENKYIFKDIFFDYYLHNKNTMFGIENIFKLESILGELKFDKTFNKTLENISKELWLKLVNNLNYIIENNINIKMEELSDLLQAQQNEIKEELEKLNIVELYESMLLLSEMINNYTDLVNEQNNRFKFLVSNTPLEKFGSFSQNYLEPPLDEIKQYYDIIQNELLKKIEEIINQMRDFSEDIKIEYNITEQMNLMVDVIKNSYDNLINYSQDFIDDIDIYDEILILYTYISENKYSIRKLNEYSKESNESGEGKKIINFNNKNYNSINNKQLNIKRLNKTKYFNINNVSNIIINNKRNYIINKKNKNAFNYKYTIKNKKSIKDSDNLGFYKKNKRRLSSNADIGTISISTINKECQKFVKIMNKFNKTYLSKDYTKIKTILLKEESKINKYLINSGRTIELSLLKLSSIITEDKINDLKALLYLKHNQISEHINNFLNLISIQSDNYINLLSNSSEMLNMTYNEINQKIVFDFEVIKEYITSQTTEMDNFKEKNEKIDGNEIFYNLFKEGNLYQPIEINKINNLNFSNNTFNEKNNINLTKSKTITKYYNQLKNLKYKIFNETNKKFKGLNDNLKEALKYITYNRRLSYYSLFNENNNLNKHINYNEEKNNNDMNPRRRTFDLFCPLEKDFAKQIKQFLKPIPIMGILYLYIEPEVYLGFCFGLDIETKSSFDQEFIIKKTGIMIIDNDEEEEDEDDTKLILKVVGKGEVSLSVSAGIVVCDTKVFTLAILAGIKGLLGSGEIGLELIINISKGNVITDRFFVIKAFYVSLFLKLKIGIHVKFYDNEFDVFIFEVPLFGVKIEKHNIIKKALAKAIYEDFIKNNKYQLP